MREAAVALAVAVVVGLGVVEVEEVVIEDGEAAEVRDSDVMLSGLSLRRSAFHTE